MADSKQAELLAILTAEAEASAPDTRLPTVRELMRQHNVSQAIVERVLDELSRAGLIRREPSRGIFVDGFVPQNRVLGICGNDQTTDRTNAMFREGLRESAAALDFQVADFGNRPIREICFSLLDPVSDMGFAGLILDLSTSAAMHIDADDSLAARLRDLGLPMILTRPLPAVGADCVSADDFETFRKIGERLAGVAGPVLFIGNQGLPTLARYYGLEAGLAGSLPLTFEITNRRTGGAWRRAVEILNDGWDGALVIGAPPNDLRDLDAIAAADRDRPPGRLVVTVESGDQVPTSLRAHVVTKPTREMGAAAARLLVRRLERPRALHRHEVVSHPIKWL